MYSTTVNVRNILETKTVRKGLILLMLWPILIIACLIIGARVTYYAIPVMFILFLSIIPITIYLSKKTAPYRGKNAYTKKQLSFHVKDGELYTDDIKLNPEWNPVDKVITLEGMYPNAVRFEGFIEAPYTEGFIEFLKEQNAEICEMYSGKSIFQ